MIIATAGHVDHGKTTLVRALTGVDTDRLAEEKRRGLTIEPGFAYRQLADGGVLGFVDLPGHQRFVHNMLACVAGADMGLLVVAADDGPMPQTVEHLDILALMGVPALVVALSRIDRVDAARRRAACEELRELLADGPFADAPVYPLSAPTGEGIEALHVALEQHALAGRRADTGGHFRLALDRSFSLRGIGVVVTGTVHAGRVTRADTVVQMPGGRPLRVRGLHADDQPAEAAGCGQRVAINVSGAGLQASQMQRGDWLVAPPLEHASDRFDACLRLLPSAPRALRHWSEVHLHIGAAHRHAHVAVLGAGSIAPGDEALVQLVLDAPVHALRGDRLVIRDQSASLTLGGGRVLDPFSPRRGRARPARLRWLRALAEERTGDALRAVLSQAANGVGPAHFARLCNLDDEQCDRLLLHIPHRRLQTTGGDLVIDETHWQTLLDAVLAGVRAWHQREPRSQGPDIAMLARHLPGQPPVGLLSAAAQTLLADGRLARKGLMLHLPDHAVRLNEDEQVAWQRAAAVLAAGGGSAPTLHQLARHQGVTSDELRVLLEHACAAGLCLRVSRNRYLPLDTVRAFAVKTRTLAEQCNAEGFSVAQFRDHAGVGRNFAVDLLECFDRAGLTRRAGEHRHLEATPASLFGDDEA